jgi:AcrR family transcriptional regulator
MSGYTKGANTRERIVNAAREIFNEFGIWITLSTLANKMEITLGMLTYHFPTKDGIFLAIAENYERQRESLRKQVIDGKFDLEIFYEILGNGMDLQYDYRCAMRYIASISNNQSELLTHTIDRYRFNRQLILKATQIFVSQGELQSKILEESNFTVFLFTFSSLLTSWPINLEIYDVEEKYENIKPVYLNGIFSTYIPYITPLGEKTLRKLNVMR